MAKAFPDFPVMGRLQRQADEIGNLVLALMLPQAAEIQILLHGRIFRCGGSGCKAGRIR